MHFRVGLLFIFAILLSIAAWFFYQQPENTPEKISGAYQALNLWSQQRAYPDKAIPDAGHYAAYEYARQNIPRLEKRTPADTWQAIGPHNLGGRTLALAINAQNPNTIYAGSASGGLWRSYSGGKGAAAWSYVPTGHPVLAVSAIAIASNDSNVMYIGTGEVYNYQNAGTGAAYRSTRGTYGIGILKTSDGGQTWEKSLDWSYNQMRGVWAVKINPLNPNTVWAATTEGVYKSTDAGNTWTQVHNVIMANDLVINPVDTATVVVGCGNFASAGFGIYRTTDGGQSWTQRTDGLPTYYEGKIQLDIYPPSPNIVYASIGNGFSQANGASWLCRSTDGGDTWSVLSTFDYSKWQGWFSHDVAVNPVDSTEVIAIGIDIHRSNASGAFLNQQSSGGSFSGTVPPQGPEGPPGYSHSDHHDVIYHPGDPDIIYFANDGGVFRTVDGAETFESCNGGYQTGQFYGGFACAATDSQVAIGGFQDNSTAVYSGSPVWSVRLIGGDGGWAAIDPTNADIMFGSWQFLNLLKSTSGGASFFNSPVPGGNRPTVFIAPFVIATDNPQVMYAGRDVVYRSENGGQGWTGTNSSLPLDGNPVLAMAISPQNSDVVYAATAPFVTGPGVYRTVDGGASWQNITASLPNRFPGDLAVDPADEATVYIAYSGFGTEHVFKSEDYGDTWNAVGVGLPDVPTNAVAVDPENSDHVYVGNDIGVYLSADGGATWTDFSEGLPDAVIAMDLTVSPLNRKLRVATHGNGAYERDLAEPSTGIVSDDPAVSRDFSLAQNYPNPFNPSTVIRYRLSNVSEVELAIYNLLGQEVRVLVEKRQGPGAYEAVWDGSDAAGKRVASGVYIYRLWTDRGVLSKRMVLTR